MARAEKFGEDYNLPELDFDLKNAPFPGIELSFCKGDGSLFSPYEFHWDLEQEMMPTPEQVGALASQIIDSIGMINSYFHLKANGITFIVILHDAKHTGSLLLNKYPFESVEAMMSYKTQVNEVLKALVGSFQNKL
jgi:hypothetical protein